MSKQLSALSNRALELALTLPSTDHLVLARWLYRYGTIPSSEIYEHSLGEGDVTLAALGLTEGGQVRQLLEANYDAATYPGWIGFSLVGMPIELKTSCKLYVSPRPEALAEAFPIISSVFGTLEVPAFKIGRGLSGLLRTDKIVAHFHDRQHLIVVADELERKLSGLPSQGVPFTTQCDAKGMLSWGIDPPLGDEAMSWRVWITRRLAKELLAAKRLSSHNTVDSILESIARAGIDPITWAVDEEIFENKTA